MSFIKGIVMLKKSMNLVIWKHILLKINPANHSQNGAIKVEHSSSGIILQLRTSARYRRNKDSLTPRLIFCTH